jgi:hypothetical protein
MINKYTGIAVLVSITGVAYVLLYCNMEGVCQGAYSVAVLLPQVPSECGCHFFPAGYVVVLLSIEAHGCSGARRHD